jgi:hypothetical protein
LRDTAFDEPILEWLSAILPKEAGFTGIMADNNNARKLA